MQPSMSPYHFEPHFTPTPHYSAFSRQPIAPHASQFHAASTPQLGDPMFRHYQPHAAHAFHDAAPAVGPAHAQPLNSYDPEATVTNITNHEVLHMGQKLKIGDVVEVNRHGHSEFAYVNANNQLKPINEAVIHHVPQELRSHILKVGGPAYFAHELHNRIATEGLTGQFKASDNHGPLKPLI